MTAKLGDRYRNGSPYRAKPQRDATPSGWRAKLESAIRHDIGTVLTAQEARDVALVAGLIEAGRVAR